MYQTVISDMRTTRIYRYAYLARQDLVDRSKTARVYLDDEQHTALIIADTDNPGLIVENWRLPGFSDSRFATLARA